VVRLALSFGLFLALAPAGAGAPRALPLAPCTISGGIEARCGTFGVPESRADPDGRAISLRVAVLPAHAGVTKADPIVHIAGGPGGSAIADARFVRSVFSAANASRDIVLVDQRGTGGSSSLTCPPPRTPITTIEGLRAHTKRCVASLEADLSQYTTVPAMDDLADVLRALGYGEVNLYGGSYGATAAQYFVVQHPELVRTAILDGATLLDVPIFERWGRNGDRALRAIFARCVRSRRCAAAYPRARREVFEVIAALRRKPVRVNGTLIDAATAAGAIQLMSRSPDTAAEIPWLAHEASRRYWLPLQVEVERSQSLPGMSFWTIVCNEPWARQNPARTAAASRGTYLADRVAIDVQVAGAVCSIVPKAPQPEWSSFRPTSDEPILFVVGGADPQDPLANVAGAKSAMPNSRTVVVPGAGHGAVQLGCMPKLARQFIDAGSAAGLDTSCVRRYKPPPFVVVRRNS
jgi:pimeloyl-ACP methyl ester carboxylesterase